MFCAYCGKKINDEANFCPYCGTKLKDVLPNQQPTQDKKENPESKKKELTISAVEKAILKAEKTKDKILLLQMAGDAYALGNIGAKQDYKKAIEKYKAATELGSAECEHSLGLTYAMEAFDEPGEEGEWLTAAGVLHVAQSYKKGYEPARDTLQSFLDQGLFPNFRTIDDLLDLCLSEIV